MLDARLEGESDSAGSRSTSDHRVAGGTFKVVTCEEISLSSMPTPEPKKGEKISGSAARTMVEGSSAMLPLCAGTVSSWPLGTGILW